MATTNFSDHLLDGDHASRPAANAVPEGALYACTDHALIYKSNGSAWSTWATLGAAAVVFAGARVYNSANISITTTGVTQVLTFNSERYDTDGYHDTGSNTDRLTVPAGKGGEHLITGHAQYAANATGQRAIGFTADGTNIAAHNQDANASGTTLMSLATVYDLADGAIVRMTAFQTSGGSLNIEVSGNRSPEFSISKLG